MPKAKEKFSAQADPKLIHSIRSLAKQEGRQLHSLIDEAFEDLLEKHKGKKPRQNVMAQYEASISKYGQLYERLAK